VLGLVVTDEVFRRFPAAGEGLLSRSRAAVVRSGALAEMAADLEIGAVLLLGKGEDASGGRERPSILADAMEAVIGAVYLDGGLDAARMLVLRLVVDRLDGRGDQDPKSRLHELVAQRSSGALTYRFSEAGPEHDKHFSVVVLIDGTAFGEGTGPSKKQAEQAAALVAWLRLTTPSNDADRTSVGPESE
jgi:ribonuclease-3